MYVEQHHVRYIVSPLWSDHLSSSFMTDFLVSYIFPFATFWREGYVVYCYIQNVSQTLLQHDESMLVCTTPSDSSTRCDIKIHELYTRHSSKSTKQLISRSIIYRRGALSPHGAKVGVADASDGVRRDYSRHSRT